MPVTDRTPSRHGRWFRAAMFLGHLSQRWLPPLLITAWAAAVTRCLITDGTAVSTTIRIAGSVVLAVAMTMALCQSLVHDRNWPLCLRDAEKNVVDDPSAAVERYKVVLLFVHIRSVWFVAMTGVLTVAGPLAVALSEHIPGQLLGTVIVASSIGMSLLYFGQWAGRVHDRLCPYCPFCHGWDDDGDDDPAPDPDPEPAGTIAH